MKNNFEVRLAKRDCFCRGCDKKLNRDVDTVLYTYSFRNRGQNIIFCKECVIEMYKLFNKEEV